MKTTFRNQYDELSDNVNNVIYFHINSVKREIFEINFVNFEVKHLNDDFGTIWVKSGSKIDCHIRDIDLGIRSMIADIIARKQEK
jgi:hypothetical protein